MLKNIIATLVTVAVGTSASFAHAQITQIFPTGYSVTGVRQSDSAGNLFITGGTGTSPFLYSGPLPSSTNPGGTYTSNLTPVISGSAVTGGATFYGPNTPYFNSWIGSGNVLAVGTYKATTTSTYQDGVMYLGPLTGSTDGSNWTTIKVPDILAGLTGQVGDTIPHSTMGNLVVGNFNTQSSNLGQAFIYNITDQTYSKLSFGDVTSAFGIWQNGGSASTQYTIVGGYTAVAGGSSSMPAEGQVGYIVNYDDSTKSFSNRTDLNFNNVSNIFTHIEGIVAYSDGFSLAAMSVRDGLLGAAYGFVPVTADGFGTATWQAITSDSPFTTGDTVINQSVMGLYQTSGGDTASFVWTQSVPEIDPNGIGSVVALVLGSLGLLERRRQKDS